MCATKFSELICHPIAAQFLGENLIALFEFEQTIEGVAITSEKHYKLVVPENLSQEELQHYQTRPF